MTPLISIIIPTFNRERMVKEAVESAVSQTFRGWELLVVDDGSTDRTAKCLAPYLDDLQYITSPHRGVSAARNLGIHKARGEWVSFLDSDDLWLPQKLARQLQAIQGCDGVPLCYTDETWIRNGARVNPGLKHRKYTGWIFERCLPLCIISPSSALIHKDLVKDMGGFDEGLPACEDYDLWLRITLRFPVLFLDEKLIIKRGGHQDQLSRSFWGMDRFRVRALWKILYDPMLQGAEREAVVRELRHKCRVLVNGSRKRGKKEFAEFFERLMNPEGLEVDDAWEAVLHPHEASGP